MLSVREFTYPASSKEGDICAKVWTPGSPKLVVQICHGMAEHMERYDAFARFLCEHDILVCALDYRGHGKTIKSAGKPGYFADSDGWTHTVNDILKLRELVSGEEPALPWVLLGHSMGSFLARTIAARAGERYDAYIFSGTAGKNPILPIAKVLARAEIKKRGKTGESLFLDSLAFGAYNRVIEDAQTPFDWLSRDREVVQRYLDDKTCGFCFTAGGFYDLFCGLSEIQKKDWAQKVPDKPILLIAGDHDPVGNCGKGVREVEKRLLSAGKHKVRVILYPGARHEVLNETCKETVYKDVLSFLNELPRVSAESEGV